MISPRKKVSGNVHVYKPLLVLRHLNTPSRCCHRNLRVEVVPDIWNFADKSSQILCPSEKAVDSGTEAQPSRCRPSSDQTAAAAGYKRHSDGSVALSVA